MAEDISFLYRAKKKKFPLNEQKQIGELLSLKKRKFNEDKRNPQINKSVYNEKRKKWTSPFTQQGYIQPTVRQIFTDLKGEKNDSADFESATKFVTRCMEKYERGEFDTDETSTSKKFRLPGAGAPVKAVELRESLFDYFIDIRCSLKGRLPLFLLQAKANELYTKYCELKREAGETPEELRVNRSWLKRWAKEKRISLRNPNKRFSIPHDVRKRRIMQFLKNMWLVRYFWLHHYKREPNIISADQMPLHRNESSSQKTLNFSGRNTSCFVKENHSLSRERCTVMTIASSSPDKSKVPPPEFVFKGKGTRTTLNPPGKIKVQWAEKGSYRTEHMVEFVNRLPPLLTAFMPSNRDVFTLDDYSAHLTPPVEKALFSKGYFLVHIGGGITGDVQVNDTDYHQPLKKEYREDEMGLMVKQLTDNPNKIPAPSRDEIMGLFEGAWKRVYDKVDNVLVYKRNMITLALDGSEDHLASQKLFDLVGQDMIAYRDELMAKPPPATLKELRKLIIPPEGVKHGGAQVPPDEGCELLDGEEEEWDEPTVNDEESDGDDSDLDDTNVDTNVEVTTAITPNEPPPSVLARREDVIRFDKVGDAIKEAKTGAPNSLLPFLAHMENTFLTQRRKLLKTPKVDGVLSEALTSASGSGVQQSSSTHSTPPADHPLGTEEEDKEMAELRADMEERDAILLRERTLNELDEIENDRNIFDDLNGEDQ